MPSAYPEEDEFQIEDDFEQDTFEAEAKSLSPTENAATNDPVVKSKRKLSKERKSTPKKAKRQKLDDTNEDLHTIAWAPADVQALYLADKQAAAFPQATLLERDESKIPDSFLMDVSAFQREDRNNLKEFISKALPELKAQVSKPSKKKGSPRALVVCSAALRAADCCRDLKTLTPQGEVAKLFSKHFKLSEHVAYCEKTAFSLAAGTPDRIVKLLSSNALGLDSLQYLILDITHLDAKKKSLLDMKEARDVFLRDLLGHAGVKEKLKAGRMKLVVY